MISHPLTIKVLFQVDRYQTQGENLKSVLSCNIKSCGLVELSTFKINGSIFLDMIAMFLRSMFSILAWLIVLYEYPTSWFVMPLFVTEYTLDHAILPMMAIVDTKLMAAASIGVAIVVLFGSVTHDEIHVQNGTQPRLALQPQPSRELVLGL